MGKKTVCILLVIFSLGILAYLSFKIRADYERRRIAWQILQNQIEKEVAGFQGESGIIIKDLSRGWQISVNPDQIFASASLAKVPVMACCFCAAQEGRLGLEETQVLKTRHKSLGSGVLKNAQSDTEFSIEKLIELMICESDNTAANMLIERLEFDYLNNCFKKLGLKNTNLSRRMMDFKSRRRGRENYINCQDLAFMLEEIYRGRLINRNISGKCLGLLKRQKIRDRIPARLPANTPVAHKTGLERGICHDAGIVFTAQGDFLICVLTRHSHKTAKQPKEFIRRIAELVYNCYQK